MQHALQLTTVRATKASSDVQRLVLPESLDRRILSATSQLAARGVCQVHLVGNRDALQAAAIESGVRLPADVVVHDPSISTQPWVNVLSDKLRMRGIDEEQILNRCREPAYVGAALLAAGIVDGCLVGAATPSADVLRAGIQVVGLASDSTIVTGAFLVLLGHPNRAITFGDCVAIPEPTSRQLAEIALHCADVHRSLTQEEPNVAFLSYSTRGSSPNRSLDRIRDALAITRALDPTLVVDGELQLDAALVPRVASLKAGDSPVAGRANVLIFPCLDAANIGYKIAERLAGARAIGPILSGLAKPFYDLSRGCADDDIVAVAEAMLARLRAT